MIAARLPATEAPRLANLREFAILDTSPEPAFDDLAMLAAHICQMPSACVNLLDTDRQWSKARVGSSATESARSIAFCAHTILEPDELMVVEDARTDPRFADNPLVTGAPFIRFYAGASLVTPQGHAIGTLCVFDAAPRRLSHGQLTALRALTRRVVDQLEMRRQSRQLTEQHQEYDRLLARAEKTRRAMLGVLEDEQLARARLRDSEARYRQLFENNPVPIWLYDPSSLRILSVNEAAVKQYGYSREEFLGLTIRQLHLPEDHARLVPSADSEPPMSKQRREWRHRKKDGTVIEVEISSGLLTLQDTPVRLVLATDITEKKLMEEKFLHAQRLESIGMLAAGIAHDLNNVLAPILMGAPMLRQSLSNPRDARILDALQKSAERGAGLVKQILGFAHTASGELRITQVKHLARDIIGVMEETFPKLIVLEHQVPNNLWPALGNATQIHQILLNLCVNARDAMPHGGTLRLCATNRQLTMAEAGSIPQARPGAWLVLEVSDTGTGIAPETLEKIWTPFFTTKSFGKGTGLGLSTVRNLVESHKGFIELRTEVGRGTTFRVFLPAVERESDGPDDAIPAEIPPGQGEHILVVDDDAGIRGLVATILEQHGYRTTTSVDGADAITVFSARPGEFKLVLTDVDMPRINGATLASTLRQIRPDIRIIAMSGIAQNETSGSEIAQMQKLVHGFLLKPFKAEDLLVALHDVLHPQQASRTAMPWSLHPH